MSSVKSLPLVLAVLCAACSKTPASEDDSTTTSSTESSGESGSSGGSEESGESESGSETTGEIPDAELCEAQLTEEDCDAVPVYTGDDPVHAGCQWITLHEVAFESESCAWGATRSSCVLTTSGEAGCGSNDVCNMQQQPVGLYELVDGTVYVGHGEYCNGAGASTHGYCSGENVPEECACLCDDSFPGVAPSG